MLTKRFLRQLNVMRLWLTPGMKVKRFVSVAVFGTLFLVSGVITAVLWVLEGNRDVISAPIERILVSAVWQQWGGWISLGVALVGVTVSITAVARLNRSLLSNWFSRPKDAAVVLHKRLSLAKGPRIVALGGGTGLSNLLRGLKIHSSNVTAVVTVSDDGGSSGRLRTAFDMPAPGDISDCLAALSDNESELSRLLEYRFARGNELKGHTFGNLFITTLTEVEGDFGKAIRTLNALLNLTGAVYPATPEPVTLHAVKRNGTIVDGESNLALVKGSVSKVSIEPANPTPTPEVLGAIFDADAVVLGPGSLFTSTIPPLLVPAIRRAIQGTQAKLVYVCNIMTEAGETDGFSAFDHVKAIYQHLGRYPDQVIVNGSSIDPDRLTKYRQEGADVVLLDSKAFEDVGIQVLPLPLLGDGPHAQHDSKVLADWLAEIAQNTELAAMTREILTT